MPGDGAARGFRVNDASRQEDDESLGERVFIVLLVAVFAAFGALLVILLLVRVSGGVVEIEHILEPGQHQVRAAHEPSQA